MKDKYPDKKLSGFCRLLGVSRQALYQHEWRREALSNEAELIIQQVIAIRQCHPVIGVRKLYVMLEAFIAEHGIKIGRDGLFNLLAAYNLLVRRRKRKVTTTQSWHRFHKYPNLIKGMQLTGINQLWVSDITYYKTGNRFTYLSFVSDAYSHKIVGFHAAESLETIHSLEALKMAIKSVGEIKIGGITHHSDRGVQYCSDDYVKLLQDKNIAISMTQSGDPLENAMAERVNGIIKEEYLNHYTYKTKQEVEQKLQTAVELYNTQRPHMSCSMLTPAAVHANNLPVVRKWKNYYKKQEQAVNP
jgi:transposase InsO family protein